MTRQRYSTQRAQSGKAQCLSCEHVIKCFLVPMEDEKCQDWVLDPDLAEPQRFPLWRWAPLRRLLNGLAIAALFAMILVGGTAVAVWIISILAKSVR